MSECENLVSIIMPTYNVSDFVVESIKSVLSQTCTAWELIIVDDCSTDKTINAISVFLEDTRIHLIVNDINLGGAISRNKAIDYAKGRYISFLDSDDLWLPNKLEKQIAFMQQNNVAFSYAAYEKIDVNGNVFGVVNVPKNVAYKDLLKKNCIGCLTAIYDTEKLGKIYMPLIKKRQDLGLWLKILKKTPFASATPGILSQYRVRSDSISANKRIAAHYTWKLYREIEGLNFFIASYYFTHYAINGVLSTKLPRFSRVIGRR